MLQYAIWIGVYILSIRFMTKNAGRNNPAWGAFFVLLTFPMMFVSSIPTLYLFTILSLPINKLTMGISLAIFSALLSLIVAYVVSIISRKKDLSRIEKKTVINYKISSITIGLLGLIALVFIQLTTGKFDSWLFALIFVAVMHTLNLNKRSKIDTNINISDLKDKQFVLFLRSFSSTTIKSKSTEGILTATEPGRIEEHISSLIPDHMSFVAIGNPEDYLPSLGGATKIYADNDSWRDVVAEYMSYARKIIILEGATKGLIWELEYIRSNIQASKVAIITYPAEYRSSKSYQKKISYSDFANELCSLGYNLPSHDIGADAVITFNKNWDVLEIITGNNSIKQFVTRK